MFTIEQLITEVRELATEFPDNHYFRFTDFSGYNICAYDKGNCDNGTVGCIFGQAFDRLGVDLSKERLDLAIAELLFDFGLSNSSIPGIRWCSAVQNAQDQGNVWTEAIVTGDKLYPQPTLGGVSC